MSEVNLLDRTTAALCLASLQDGDSLDCIAKRLHFTPELLGRLLQQHVDQATK